MTGDECLEQLRYLGHRRPSAVRSGKLVLRQHWQALAERHSTALAEPSSPPLFLAA